MVLKDKAPLEVDASWAMKKFKRMMMNLGSKYGWYHVKIDIIVFPMYG